MGGYGWGAVGGSAEAGFRGDAVKIWIISAMFRGRRGSVGVIENVKRRFDSRRGVHETFVVTGKD